ncbi:MAG TPA: signal peptide peptidase SppA [Dysgonamonadaceae bacterium]|nr:signal peptide peptidase SppA [Dysgonamonadaceae bacterium]HPD43961.1 signal peptide peptidase SppA [Dysgonamonadaceae bacterium]HRS41918.1 signal peptide peptidase SppA [Dysgonamonadaceae bacterium]
MKDFFKIMLASALGFVIATILLSIISIIMFFSVASSMTAAFNNDQYVVQDNSILNLRLSGVILERISVDDPFSGIMPQDRSVMGLAEITSAIRKARNEDKIKGIYIDSRIFSASPATLSEIRQELLRFKESGKFIVAYADNYTQAGYYLASVADKVAINPQGSLDIHGLASIPMFFKEALQKMGIEVQVFKVGIYKSAVEPFTSTEMSPANREQVTSYLNDLWSFMAKDMTESRKLNISELDSIANQMPALKDADYLLQTKLVDTLLYETEMKNYVRSLLDLDVDAKIPAATVEEMSKVKSSAAQKKSDNQIALLYAFGDIVSGNGATNIQDKFMVNEIEKLRKDDKIKAVVFRVNSGGGSAYASEQIWKAITDLKKVKPVVVSMGDMAASGGYYISCNASKIIAQPTTITGSIGIFGMFPNFKGTTEKLGLDFDAVKTHRFSDFGNVTRPMDESEKSMLQAYIDRGYDTFLTRCADGRNIPKDTLEKYAEGRVWTGNQALKIGLVDELGNLLTAIETAAELADLGEDYLVYEYPKKRTFIEEFLNRGKEDLAAQTLKEYLGESYHLFMTIKNMKDEDFIQARIPYDLNIR